MSTIREEQASSINRLIPARCPSLRSWQGDKAKILDLKFCPDSTTTFVTVGVKLIKYFSIQGTNISGKKGILGKKGKLQPYPCCAFLNNNLVVGCADGSLYQLVNRNVKKAVKAHGAAINTIFVTNDNQVITGSRDGKVKFFDPTLNPTKTFDIKAIIGDKSLRPIIRSVALREDGSRLLVGTEGAEILEVMTNSNTMVGDEPLIMGHFKDELWGCAAHPLKAEFATVGDDGTLRIWNVKTNALRGTYGTRKIGGMARSCSYSPDGALIAVGFGGSVGKGRQKCDGEFKVFNSENLEVVHEARDSKEWIQDLKFSPDGKVRASEE